MRENERSGCFYFVNQLSPSQAQQSIKSDQNSLAAVYRENGNGKCAQLMRRGSVSYSFLQCRKIENRHNFSRSTTAIQTEKKNEK